MGGRLLKIWSVVVLTALIAFTALPGIAKPKDTLVIGISQFPRNFNPNIESMLAKSYVLAMTRRPLTVYDADWNLQCMLCVDLPSFENGTAKRETTVAGKAGIAVTYTLRTDATWGDGTPVTTKDVVFTWELGRNRKTGFGNLELYERITSIDVHDDKKFTLHVNKYTCEYAAMAGLNSCPPISRRQTPLRRKTIGSKAPTKRIRPTPASGTVPIESPRSRRDRISFWSAIRPGGAKSPRSNRLSSRPSKTPPP